MKVEKLAANPDNPRKITPQRLEQLKKSMTEYGDLSGIVFNIETQNLVTGHQRTQHFDGSEKVCITKTFPKPSKTGTIAVGYILLNGERFNYREVKWNKNKEKAATIAANKNAGDWDNAKLKEWMNDLYEDVKFDMDLTMFGEADIKKILGEEKKKKKMQVIHTCPECGHEF